MTYNFGVEIKKVIKRRGMTITEFARRINKSRENVYDIFTRRSLDTDLLKTISQVLDYDFLSKSNESSRSSYSESANENNAPYTKIEQELLLMREEMLLMRKEMIELRDRVGKVESKRKA